MNNIDHINLGWIIGIIEGEGYIGLNSGGGNSPIIEIAMTDEDVIIRVATIFELMTGTPHIIDYRTDARPSNRKEAFRVRSYGDNARTILLSIIPHLGYRRRQKAWQVLNGYREPRLKLEDIFNVRKSVDG